MASIITTPWGEGPQGAVQLLTLTNAAGNTVSILDLGGIVQSIRIGGTELVIGYDDLAGYQRKNPYFGAIIGRYGNRIAGARFTIDGTTYQLDANEDGNQLHGGSSGFNDKVWKVEPSTTDTSAVLRLSRLSPDGEMGFPGNLRVSCTYTWTDENTLRIHYEATTDQDTMVNLTNHTYFNISGGGTILEETLQLAADRYTPVDRAGIPLGKLEDVAGSPFDFRQAKPVGRDIHSDHPQIASAHGYDHNFAVSDFDGSLREVALLTDPASGRKLRTFTTEPGVQVFTANFYGEVYYGRDNAPLEPHRGICLETQHFPDSPNQENFRTPLLKVGDTYNTTTVYRFE